MDFWEVIKKRHCVRRFQDKAVEKEKIEKILYAATSAPSAGNVQDWRFIIVQSKSKRFELSEAALGQEQVVEAPVVIVICSNLDEIFGRYGERGAELYSIQNAAAATQNLLMAATDLGLGACWVGAFDEEKVKKILDLSGHYRPLAIIPLGYPAEEPETHPKKSLDEVVTWL